MRKMKKFAGFNGYIKWWDSFGTEKVDFYLLLKETKKVGQEWNVFLENFNH